MLSRIPKIEMIFPVFLSLLKYFPEKFRYMYLHIKRPPFKSDTPPTFPRVLHHFESFYDEKTGGWHSFFEDLRNLIFDKNRKSHIQYDSIELEVGHFYYQFIRLTKPLNVLETGVSKGYSTCCIATALKKNGQKGHVYCVDPFPYPHLWRGTYLEEYITYFPKMSQDSLPELGTRTYDLLTIDSLHNYDTCMWEIMNFEKFLKPGGYILMHDSIYFEGVKAVVKQLTRNPRFEVVTLNTPRTHGTNQPCPGLSVVRKIRDGEPHLIFENCYKGWGVYGSKSFKDLAHEVVYDGSTRKLHVPQILSQDGLMEMEFEMTQDSKEGAIRFQLISERTGEKVLLRNNNSPENLSATFDHETKTLYLPRVISIDNWNHDPVSVNGYYEGRLRLDGENNGKQVFSLQHVELLAIRE